MVTITRTVDKFVCLFMQSDFSESNLINVVHNKSTLCSPLTFSAFKNGVSVPLERILSPNNGLSSYSQFLEAVHSARNNCIFVDVAVRKVASSLQHIVEQSGIDKNKMKKPKFFSRQLQLTSDKSFSVADQLCHGKLSAMQLQSTPRSYHSSYCLRRGEITYYHTA